MLNLIFVIIFGFLNLIKDLMLLMSLSFPLLFVKFQNYIQHVNDHLHFMNASHYHLLLGIFKILFLFS